MKAFFLILILLPINAYCDMENILCDGNDFNCVEKNIQNYFADNSSGNIDDILKMVQSLNVNKAEKNNLLGVVMMLKKDEASLEKAEKYLLDSYSLGYSSAAQNLAQLYYLRHDYLKAIKYLDIVKSYGYTYPSVNYVSWARLYAAVLILHKATSATDIEKALNLFNSIKSIDDTGASEYFVGLYNLKNNNVLDGVELLVESSKKRYVPAMMVLGDAYFSGTYVKKDTNKAKLFYKMAAKRGDGRAYYNLAMISGNENDAKSMKYYLIESAKAGFKKAIELIHKAVEQN